MRDQRQTTKTLHGGQELDPVDVVPSSQVSMEDTNVHHKANSLIVYDL